MDRGSQDGACATAKWIVRQGEKMWLDISKAFATEGLVGVLQEGLLWAETRGGFKGTAARAPKGLERVLATVWDGLFISKPGLEKFAAATEWWWSWDLSTNVWLTINIPGGGGEPRTMIDHSGNRRWGLSTCEGKDLADDLWLYSQLSSGWLFRTPGAIGDEHPEFPHSNIFS